ncbi:class I glutamine amidotransferase-like protein [Immersiella caudata]|uniref:Class I glutamine amidotransferase-like protein n=1 Tax=Immersiella caudata TaxID=314043 RepID=A0AA39WRY3_9PEZI|nr:class I glutamine amidotransferase-like protein [Immersiella caudata]
MASPPPLRLAILEADTPLPGVNARYDGYHGVFKHLLVRAVDPAPLESALTLSRHDVVNDLTSYPSFDAIDAILITGSKHSAFENDPWITTLVDFTRRAIAHPRVRIIGICFGHQIVSRALNIPVHRSEAGWEVSVTETTLTPAGQSLFGGRKTLKIQQMHRDQAFGLPPSATLLASTPLCPNHGFLIPLRLITVQGHPEFTSDIMQEILETRHATGLFSDEVYQSGMARRSDDHDGVLMARAFLKFLRETQETEPGAQV